MKKQKILVLNKDGKLVNIINRVLKFENIGNYNPAFVTYNKTRCLVQSHKGDLSDPFRRDSSYLDHLYIVDPYCTL